MVTESSLAVLAYTGHAIRMAVTGGDTWWVLKDVCDLFGETNYRRVAKRLDEDEKGVSQIDTPGGKQAMITVNEPGLYNALFIMQPKKARGVSAEYVENRTTQLRAFRRWVTHEVLPSIRKNGYYAINHGSGSNWRTPAREKSLALRASVKQEIRQMELDEMDFGGRYPRDITFLYKQCYNNEYLSDKAIEELGINENQKLSAKRGLDIFYTDEAVQMAVNYVWERLFKLKNV